MTNHQPAGIPIGGQFAPNIHAEPDVSLSASPAPRAHDEFEHQRLRKMANDRHKAANKALDEQDSLSMEVLSSSVRRDYPGAAELRIKRDYGDRNYSTSYDLGSVRDRDGNDLTADDKDWRFNAEPDGGRARFGTLMDIRPRFYEINDFDVDLDAGEIIVPLDRNYAEGIKYS